MWRHLEAKFRKCLTRWTLKTCSPLQRLNLIAGKRTFPSSKSDPGQGCAVTVKRSAGRKYVQLGCDRGGSSVSKSTERKRQTTSRRIECPFLISANYSKKTGKWKLKTVVSEHNHQKSLYSSGHSTHRKLTVDQVDKVKNMTNAGAKPAAILSALRMTKSDTFANLRTIYNARVNMRN